MLFGEVVFCPTDIAKLRGTKLIRRIMRRLDAGSANIAVTLPKTWKRIALTELEREKGALTQDEFQLAVGLIELIDNKGRRSFAYDSARAWSENVQRAHDERRFAAIICEEPGRPGFLTLSDAAEGTDDGDDPLDRQLGIAAERSSEQLAVQLGALVRNASEIIIVDPYFHPATDRFRRPIANLLAEAAKRGTQAPFVGFALGAKNVDQEWLETGVTSHGHALLPNGWSATFLRFAVISPIGKEKEKETVHNRYVLTNLGGVKIEPGVDDGPGTYDVNVLAKDQFLIRWSQYAELFGRATHSRGTPFVKVGEELPFPRPASAARTNKW